LYGVSNNRALFAIIDHVWFTRVGLVLGLIFSLPLLIVAFGTKENELPPPPKERPTLRSLFATYKELLANRTYRKYFALRSISTFLSNCTGITTLIIFALFNDIPVTVLGFTIGTLVFVVQLVSGVPEIGFFIPNVLLMRKYGKQSPYLMCMPMIMAAALIGLFMSPSMPIWIFLIAMALLGAGRSSLGFVTMSMLPDLADVDEMIYGKRREGGTAGINALGAKTVGGIASFVFGIIYTAFGLEVAELQQSEGASPGAINALRVIFGALPILCCIAMILITRTYRLDQKRHDMVKALIKEKRENGTVNATAEQVAEMEKITGIKYGKLWISEGTQIDCPDN